MNKILLIGRLGKDPELRYTSTGSPIANLRIATDESYTDRDGNKVDHTEWHTVVVFQRQAENCQAYLKKGSLVFVEGSLQTRKWQDKQGQDRYTTEIKANRIQFLDRKNQQNTQGKQASSLPAYQDSTSSKQGYGVFPTDTSGMDACPWDSPAQQIPNALSNQKANSPSNDYDRAVADWKGTWPFVDSPESGSSELDKCPF